MTRRSMLTSSAAAGAALLFAGCSAANSARSGVVGGSAATHARNTFTVGSTSDLDAQQFLRTGVDPTSFSLVFDTLVGLDPQTLGYTPQVARDWRYNADRTRLTVDLRDDVFFHTGRPLRAQDAVFSIQQTANPLTGAQVGATVEQIKAIRVTGPLQFQIDLHRPLSPLLNVLLFTGLVDRETYADLVDAKKVIGTGPFRFTGWTPEQSFAFTANDHYWGGAPHLKNVLVQVFQSPQALTAALRSVQVDVGYGVLPLDATLLSREDHLTAGSTEPNFAEWYLGVNTKIKPFDDVRVRQALAWAIDRDRVVAQAFSGFGSASSIPWTTKLPGVTDADRDHYGFDLERSRTLLRAAGAHGTKVPLFIISGNTTAEQILEIVQYDLEAAGFRVDAQEQQAVEFQGALQKEGLPGLWINILGQTFLPLGTILLGNAPVKAGQNSSNVTDPRYTQLVDDVVYAGTPAQQAAANQALTAYFLDAAWHISIGHAPGVFLSASNVVGVGTSGPGNLDLATTHFI